MSVFLVSKCRVTRTPNIWNMAIFNVENNDPEPEPTKKNTKVGFCGMGNVLLWYENTTWAMMIMISPSESSLFHHCFHGFKPGFFHGHFGGIASRHFSAPVPGWEVESLVPWGSREAASERTARKNYGCTAKLDPKKWPIGTPKTW